MKHDMTETASMELRSDEVRILGRVIAMMDAHTNAAVEEEREKSKADMAHARRSIKQACLFAAESAKPKSINGDEHSVLGPNPSASDVYALGLTVGVRAAADAVAQVEVE